MGGRSARGRQARVAGLVPVLRREVSKRVLARRREIFLCGNRIVSSLPKDHPDGVVVASVVKDQDGADEEAGRDARHDVLGLGLASLPRARLPHPSRARNVTFPRRLGES